MRCYYAILRYAGNHSASFLWHDSCEKFYSLKKSFLSKENYIQEKMIAWQSLCGIPSDNWNFNVKPSDSTIKAYHTAYIYLFSRYFCVRNYKTGLKLTSYLSITKGLDYKTLNKWITAFNTFNIEPMWHFWVKQNFLFLK